jgi:hypothetical protein
LLYVVGSDFIQGKASSIEFYFFRFLCRPVILYALLVIQGELSGEDSWACHYIKRSKEATEATGVSLSKTETVIWSDRYSPVSHSSAGID